MSRGILILLLGMTLISGCAEWYAGKEAVRTHGEEIENEKMATAVWVMCREASIGGVTRFFTTREQRAAWSEICGTPFPGEPVEE